MKRSHIVIGMVALSAMTAGAFAATSSGAGDSDSATEPFGASASFVGSADGEGASAGDVETFEVLSDYQNFTVETSRTRVAVDDGERRLAIAPTTDGKLCFHSTVRSTLLNTGGCFEDFPSTGVQMNVFDKGPLKHQSFGVVADDVESISLVRADGTETVMEARNGGFWDSASTSAPVAVTTIRNGKSERFDLR